MSVNKVILVGNVGSDPEMRHVGERLIAEFRMATNERAYTTAAGNQIPEAYRLETNGMSYTFLRVTNPSYSYPVIVF